MHFRFKKLLLLAAVVVTGVTLAACGNQQAANNKDHTIQSGKLTIGLEGTYAPYSYHKDGKLTGFEVELSRDLAKELGLKPVFVQSKWDSLIAGLDAHKYDAVFNNVTVSAQRAKSYAYTVPYLYSKSVLIVKKGSSIKNAGDIKGLKIAGDLTTENGRAAQKLGASVVAVPGFSEAISLIESGQAKGAFNSREAFYGFKQANPNTDLTTLDASKEIPTETVAGVLSKNNPELKAKLDKALKKLEANGTVRKLSLQFFGTDVTKK
ncbi:transporter substrate-binding domain-containing protein [Periweissella ghanensis]|uniref:Amino-acid ABC transporter-binding protein n=1 Tax=Periweissella ghanensis TaxID=467997 RepID=A0ABM8ZC50_9LACO|nr:transporter substrate-binding domain-containing protein [Periweissella ghanensis]MCM0601652.1 transporter substrate-binding domain-containing protein [Periweissella ghanensis]CAH0418731.1 putative amino-acid ABC transporter-binding protein [Periweissella ghanensis]